MRSVKLAVLFAVSLGAVFGCREARVRPVDLDAEETAGTGSDESANPEPLGSLALPQALQPVALSAGYYNTCAVLANGRVACFGDNRSAFTLTGAPLELLLVDGVSGGVGLAIGKRRGCAWTDGGAFVCWPGRDGGRRAISQHVPETRQGAVGEAHVCAVHGEAGHVRCIGDDAWLQTQCSYRDRRYWVVGVEGVVEVATGATHTCARHEDGGVTCWGDNRQNQMGDGSDRVRARPFRVPALTNVQQIASHALAVQTCALGEDSTITCWGSYGVARAGGTTRLGEHTEQLPPVTGARRIGVGPWEICAATQSGTVHCYRQTLASAGGEEGVPVYGESEQVPLINSARDVTVGPLHACALLEGGDVACWGSNTSGQLGDATRQDRQTPVLATVLSGLVGQVGQDGS